MAKRKQAIILLIIAALSVLLIWQLSGSSGIRPQAASGGKDNGSAFNGKKEAGASGQTIKAAVSMTPVEFQVLQEQTAQYMQAHEGTTITLENIPGAEVYAKLKKASQMGEAPDAMLLDNAWIQEFAALGFLKPLDDRLSTEQQSQRIPSMMNQVKWNGYLWGIPRDVDPYVLIWNKKAAAEGKVDHAPLNREEMIQWNKSFLKPEEGRYGIYFDPSDNMALISMVTSLMSQPTETPHPLQKLADPNLLKALQSFLLPQEANWNSKTFSVNYPAPSDTWKPWDLLAEGKITAMITTISEFRQHKGGELALAALPINFAGKGSGAWLKGRSFSVSSRSTHVQAAADWIKEMTSPEAETQTWNKAGSLPVLLSSYSASPLRGDEQYNSYAWLVREGKVLPFEIDGAKKLDQVQKEKALLEKGEKELKTFAEQIAKLYGAKSDS